MELPFGQYRPDAKDLNTQHTNNVLNVIPRSDGYGPIKDIVDFTESLPSTCRGYFYARATDGSIIIFAGTTDRLYQLNNTDFSWDDVSQSSSAYPDLSSDAQWQFVQFGNNVIAVQENEPPQVFNISSDTEFSDLGGSPPQAAYVSIVGRFVVLSGLLSQRYRIQWSGLNAITTWTSGTNFSDFQDFPDGGIVRGVAGGEYGLVMQDQSIRRMIYSPGSEFVFQIDRVAQDRGMLAPYSLIPAGDRIFFLSAQGFIESDASGQLRFIGKEFVDKYFFSDWNKSSKQLLIGAADPAQNIVVWGYQSIDGAQTSYFDKLIIYDWSLQRWAIAEIMAAYLTSLAKPGLTLESLDSISSSIDLLPFSLDEISLSALPALSFANTTDAIGFLTGDNLEAIVETAEYSQHPYRTIINGVTPITDSAETAISIAQRDSLNDTATYGSESTLNNDGLAPLLEEGRYVRVKVRIPAGSNWTFARGVVPEFQKGSML